MKLKIGLVTAAALITVLVVYLAETRNHFFDSTVYHGAIQYWFRGDGGLVYDWLRPGNPYGFTYPPFAGLVMAPMAILPLGAVVSITLVATVLTTAVVTWWLAGPLIRRRGWTVWFALAIAVCLAISFEPVRETITFGQINVLLLALVAGDLLLGLSRGRKWAGVGIGLATAIKLTPGIFIVYLLVTRRWRAAATASGTAAGATLLAAALFPDESREFWTSALWDTNRVGVLSIVSNQSERGLLARLALGPAESKVWLVGVLVTLAFWVWRVARAPEDIAGGLALTGIVGCLVSPVSWIHHWVWLLPAIILCVEANRKALGISAYLVLTSRLTWLWERPGRPLELIGGNLYVWFGLALLIWTPIGTRRSTEIHAKDKILT
ncbi:glycosyltransferase 87 family protein [Actinoplanes sp. TRM 88003]|uniref:Glycosyltransferase 87 family protein n=1 Tax=Paractinoplanes aksuensis TaxID=2939490 RepID=A0ABT1DYS7_9ACTN|nr:glycosyltransferase 87 family protein [Actinoplanes aksuensis]MCO8275978.1 glycosyltransferase 87 family protein [Actinoplanes aksuensis]